MNLIPELDEFFLGIREDSRISPVHISLFMAIVQHWNENNCKSPVCVFSKDLMRLAKISGVATFHRSIRDLHNYGYISYKPSFNRFTGSQIHLSASLNNSNI